MSLQSRRFTLSNLLTLLLGLMKDLWDHIFSLFLILFAPEIVLMHHPISLLGLASPLRCLVKNHDFSRLEPTHECAFLIPNSTVYFTTQIGFGYLSRKVAMSVRLFLSLIEIRWHWCGIALNARRIFMLSTERLGLDKLPFLNQHTLALSMRYWLCITLTYQIVRIFCKSIILISWVVVINM